MKPAFNALRLLTVAALLAWAQSVAGGAGPDRAEISAARKWGDSHLAARDGTLPFSFTYDGKPSASMLASWPVKSDRRRLGPARTELTLIWTDPSSGLSVRCVAVEYSHYPAVEWTVYFTNAGTADTPILEDIQGLDTSFQRRGSGEFILNGLKGDFCTADSYEPFRLALAPDSKRQFSPPNHSGKSCDGPEGWPYYNLQMPDRGVIIAVGWPGQWASSFVRDSADGLRVIAGQQRTHLVLKPGEEIRTPLIALMFWKGDDVVRAQNLWRRWFIEHNLARTYGEVQPPVAQVQVEATEAGIAGVQGFLNAGIKVDVCWRDAGGASTWYPSGAGPYTGNDIWLNTGDWVPDPVRYPQGFKPFSDWVHSKGMQFLLWFEPERVGNTNSWLSRERPGWLLPGSSHGSIFNLGNAAALSWLVDHLDSTIRTQGLDWYREDMNGGGPLPAWRKNDAPDRQGMTENLYVQGHLFLWDELRRRHPGLRIDSCASGGRRNDLESMRRAVPLLRSDFQFPEMKEVVEGNQAHTYGLSSWLPFQGTGCYLYDTYSLRSFYLTSFGMGGLAPQNIAAQRQAYAECRIIAPMMYGDYYPLSPYARAADRWIAWQFHRPESGDGCIQAFRRRDCAEGGIRVRLHGLEASRRYQINDFDVPEMQVETGRRLEREGLLIRVKDRPGAAVITYRLAR